MPERVLSPEEAMAERARFALEGKLQRTYVRAANDIERKLAKFRQRFAIRDREMREKVAGGEITQEQYENWLRGQVFTGKRWEALRDDIARDINNANARSLDIVNGERSAFFTDSANWELYELDQHGRAGMGWTVYNRSAVDRLLRDEPDLLPPKRVNARKDIAWNRRNVNDAVTQGIIQGESIPDIAKRIANAVGSRNLQQMTMYARTAMTGAQNMGRLEAMRQAQSLGLKLKKEWVATHDNRTRDAHGDLDGQQAEIDEPFHSLLGDIMAPGDPNAAPANVYNCRCTMINTLPEYPREKVTFVDPATGELRREESYREWKARQEREAAEATSTPSPTYGSGVAGISDRYRQGVVDTIDNAPQAVRDVWMKHQSQLLPPEFDLPKGAHFDPKDGKVHFESEAKAYGRSDCKEENVTYFHEVGHNIDYLAGPGKRYFSAEYDGGSFYRTLYEEVEARLRGRYLTMNPGADLWWEADGFDYLLGESRQPGAMPVHESVAYYASLLRPTMGRSEYRALRQRIYDSSGDEGALRGIWDMFLSPNRDVLKTLATERRTSGDICKQKTYLNRRFAQAFAKDAKKRYNKYQRSDISDMYDSYFDPMFGLNRAMDIGHDPGYFGTKGSINTTLVATEAFAEMFSATMTGDQSLEVIKTTFPKSYGIFMDMLEAMK